MRSLWAALAVVLCLGGCEERKSRDADAEDARAADDAASALDASLEIDSAVPSNPLGHDPVVPRTDASADPDAELPPAQGSDAGAPAPVDAGVPPVPADAGIPPAPSDAALPTDAGDPPASTDAGDPPVPADAGTPPVPTDAGNPPVPIDAGDPPVPSDAGDPPVPTDAGNPPAPSDAGDPPVSTDAGDPPVPTDAEVPVDAGMPDADLPHDAGPADPDAGPHPPTCSGPPGLYKDDACQVLSDGILPYHPQYPLWSDGAIKTRFVYLPPGKRIDAQNPDRWTFPTGTRLYKTFASGALRVETRVIEKTGTTTGFDSWTLTSYAWSADQRSVSPANTNGVQNALGTGLDIPSQAQCRSCHNMTDADAPIGFNAIQLNHSGDGVTLEQLLAAELVNGSVSTDTARIPGDGAAQAALGYLHGNCGHCHGGPNPRAGMRLWSTVGMTQLRDAPIFETAICHCLERWTGRSNDAGDTYLMRVVPGHAENSGIIGRMSRRGAGEQMPPIGTNVVDLTGLATVKAWINGLEPSSCAASPVICQ